MVWSPCKNVKYPSYLCPLFDTNLDMRGEKVYIQQTNDDGFFLISAHLFQVGSDVAFYMAIVTFLIGVFGIIAISINCYGMLIVYFILLVLITLAMTTYGCLYYEEVRHDNGDAVRSLAVQLSAMTREQLISIQREFHCCGIDKYTDYLVPYHIMSAAQPTWPFTGN